MKRVIKDAITCVRNMKYRIYPSTCINDVNLSSATNTCGIACKPEVLSSVNGDVIHGLTWSGLIQELSERGYEVDAAYRRSPDQWIAAYKDGKSYDIEVTRYSEGDYEVHPDNISEVIEADTDVYENDDINDDTLVGFSKIATKSVPDSDGFYTDYTMYLDTNTGEYVFVFGDNDIYSPADGNFDWQCETEEEAWEWFNSYEGFADENDDMMESSIVAPYTRIEGAYGYTWDGRPVRVKDWDQNFVQTKSITIQTEDCISLEDLLTGGFITSEQFRQYEEEDYSIIPEEVTIRKGTHWNFRRIDNYSSVQFAIFALPEYNNMEVSVNFDWWQYDLSSVLVHPMSDDERAARSAKIQENKARKAAGLDSNGNPIMYGIKDDWGSATLAVLSPKQGIYKVNMKATRGMKGGQQVGFRSEDAAQSYIDSMKDDFPYKLRVYKMTGAAVASYDWVAVDTLYGKAFITTKFLKPDDSIVKRGR